RDHAMNQRPRLDHRRPVLCQLVWHVDSSALRLCRLRYSEAQLVRRPGFEMYLVRRCNQHTIYSPEDVPRCHSRSPGNALFEDVHKHPTLALCGLHLSKSGVNGMRSWNVTRTLVKERSVATPQCCQHLANARFKLLVRSDVLELVRS